MASKPLTLSETRRLLGELGLRPQKHLGQNFLIDGNIVRKSLELVDARPGDAAIEIGPGLGTLTGSLLEVGCRVFAVEKDPALHAHIERTLLPRYPEHLSLILGDALEYPLAGYRAEESAHSGRFKVVANLPYAISTPWMDAVIEGPLPEQMVLMLQKETADRFAAEPGSKSFGAITVFLRSAFHIAKGHRVARRCFYPVPDVDSHLFNLVRHENPFRFDKDAHRFVRDCFTRRRKQIGGLVRAFANPDRGERWLASARMAGFSEASRPEEIPPLIWRKY